MQGKIRLSTWNADRNGWKYGYKRYFITDSQNIGETWLLRIGGCVEHDLEHSTDVGRGVVVPLNREFTAEGYYHVDKVLYTI